MGNAAFGTLLKAGDGASSEAFTTIAELSNIDINPTNENADTTHHGSASGFREHVVTVRDGGVISCEGNFVADNAVQLAEYQTKFAAGTLNNYQILFPDDSATTCTMNCSVESYSVGSPIDGKATLSLNLKVNGALTWA